MRKLLFGFTVIAFLIFGFTSQVKADPSSSGGQINGEVPIVSTVTASGGSTTANIQPNGQLEANLTSTFTVTTNDPGGVIAVLKLKVNTTSGEVNGLSGEASQNVGKCIITNNDQLPTVGATVNALSTVPTVAENQNVIAYKIKFENLCNPSKSPKFVESGDDRAFNMVLTDAGTTEIKATIYNNAAYQSGTYGTYSDLAGSYQGKITCTLTNL